MKVKSFIAVGALQEIALQNITKEINIFLENENIKEATSVNHFMEEYKDQKDLLRTQYMVSALLLYKENS